jgi:hypothetical protein
MDEQKVHAKGTLEVQGRHSAPGDLTRIALVEALNSKGGRR